MLTESAAPHEPVELLADDELEAELTVAAHDPVRRRNRYDTLRAEATKRQRTYRALDRPAVTPRGASPPFTTRTP